MQVGFYAEGVKTFPSFPNKTIAPDIFGERI